MRNNLLMYPAACSASWKFIHDNKLDASSPSATSPQQDQSQKPEKYSVLLRFLASPDSAGGTGGLLIGSERNSIARAKPSWEQDPTPLAGWSIDEQRVILDTMRKCPPSLRRNPDQRHTVYIRSARHVRRRELT
jgi:hypothetical protein